MVCKIEKQMGEKTEKYLGILENIELCIQAASMKKIILLKEDAVITSQNICVDIKVLSMSDIKDLIEAFNRICGKYGFSVIGRNDCFERNDPKGFRGVVLELLKDLEPKDSERENPYIQVRFSIPILDYATEIDSILNNLQENREIILMAQTETKKIWRYYEKTIETNRLESYQKELFQKIKFDMMESSFL